MKKLYFIAFAIIGILSCLNLSSCSKDGDEPSKPEASVKMRPSSIIWENQNYTVSFNNIDYYQGTQVKSYTESNVNNYEYIYSDNNITEKIEGPSYNKEYSYRLKDGLVIYSDAEGRNGGSFEYNGTQLVLKEEDGSEITYKWENGNMSLRTYDFSDGYSFTYTDYPCYVWVPTMGASYLNGEQFEDINQFLVMGGYFGQIPKNLVMLAKDLYDPSEVITFDYEFNDYGYPTKITYNEDGWIVTGTITWEKY